MMRILFSVISMEIANAEPVLTFQRTSDCYVSTTGRVSALGFTIESWIRQTTADSENQIYTQDNSGGTGRIFYSLWSGKPTFQISGTRYSATTNLTLNTWYHFAVTRDTGGNVRMYLNGQLVYGPVYYNKYLPATSANTLTSIGLLLRAKQGYRGDLGDLRLWNTVRSQSEIQANMNHRLTGTERYSRGADRQGRRDNLVLRGGEGRWRSAYLRWSRADTCCNRLGHRQAVH
jgi:hypothetical protein